MFGTNVCVPTIPVQLDGRERQKAFRSIWLLSSHHLIYDGFVAFPEQLQL